MPKNSETVKLVAVVVTYNRLQKLRSTVERLLASSPEHLSGLVVVDNASTDGTAAWLASLGDSRLSVERLPNNRGGAGGFEHGLRMIVARDDPDWIVVMDDDGRPMPDALTAFHSSDREGWDAIAAAVYYPDGQICDMNRPSRNPFWHGGVFWRTLTSLDTRDGFHVTTKDYLGAPRQVDVSSFVGLFLSRDAVARAGFPDGRLFVYGEDGLYTLGLSAAGGRIGFFPDVKFEHDCATFGPDDRRFRPLWKVYYYHRNLLMLYRRAAGWLFWPLLCVILPKWMMKVRHHAGERRLFFALLLRAVRDGLWQRTEQRHAVVLGWAEGGTSSEADPDVSG